MNNKKSKTAEAQMLVRKPPAEVFNAFINPEVTKHFWFTKGSGTLKEGKEVSWTWEMYDLTTKVIPSKIVPKEKIEFDWYDLEGKATQVELNFKALSDENTFVTAEHYGFKEEGDELVEAIKDSTGGFTIVLTGLKCYLEYGINLRLIGDKFPKELREDGEHK